MARGNNNKRREQQHEQELRMEIIAPLWKKNWRYVDIREEVMRRLGKETYSLGTVCKDIKKLLKEWQKERLENTEERVTIEIARLDLVIKEAWAAWDRSKEDYQKRSTTAIFEPKRNKNGIKITTQNIRQMQNEAIERCYGNPKYLDVILKAMEQRCKLLGLNKTALEVSAATNGQIEIRYVDAGVKCATSEEEVRTREGIV